MINIIAATYTTKQATTIRDEVNGWALPLTIIQSYSELSLLKKHTQHIFSAVEKVSPNTGTL